MPVSKTDIKFYMTSVEPEIEQTIRSQSVGGHAAYVPGDDTASVVYPNTLVDSFFSFWNYYVESFKIDSIADITDETLLFIDGELIKVEAVSGTTLTVEERSVNETLSSLLEDDIVYGVSLNSFLNEQFNKDRKQYRCIAVRNNNAIDTASSVKVFVKQKSKNPSTKLRIAVEIPLNDYLASTATGGTKTRMDDANLINTYSDGTFVGANLRFLTGLNVGQSRIVSSYTGSTGTFVFGDSLPYAATAGDTYEVYAGPAQRVVSGVVKPDTSGSRITQFQIPSSDDPIDINVSGDRYGGSNLGPGDIFYIWIERELGRDGDSFENNSAVITLRYEV